MQRVTLKDIARELSLHHSTVSGCLRGEPRFPEATRERVRAAAERMGYRPDPALSALIAHRNRRARAPEGMAVLAFLQYLDNPASGNAALRGAPVFLKGAGAEAEQNGYKVEYHRLPGDGSGTAAFDRLLQNRGIQGLCLLPGDLPNPLPGMKWERYCLLDLGGMVRQPRLDRVRPNHYRNARRATQILVRRGYRRIALQANPASLRGISQTWRGGQEGVLHEMGLPVPAPLLEAEPGPETCRAWIEKEKPDLIMAQRGRPMYEALEAAGYRIPRDLGLVALRDRHAQSVSITSISEAIEQIGAKAVQLLIDKIHRNEIGVPALATETSIDGIWQEGETVLAQKNLQSAVIAPSSPPHRPG